MITITTPPGPILASVGSVQLNLTTGQKITVVSVQEGNANPQCGVWIGKPGIAGCSDNPLVPDQYFAPFGAGTAPGAVVACLRNAWLGVDANEDGQEDFGSAAVTLTTPPCA